MYEQHFGLRQSPFAMTPDPSLLYLTDSHREALAGLIYSIIAQKGCAVLIGAPGTGKTTLVSTILQSIPPNRAHFTVLVNPTLTSADFLELVLSDFGVNEVPSSKAQQLMHLQQFLMQAAEQGKTYVLIVDEAHKLTFELLEEIRLLTNFETARRKLFQIVLVGQQELGDTLNRPELQQLKQRVAVRLSVEPLSEDDVEKYLRHRWTKAGATQPLPFSPEAIQEIAHYSGGIPRVINAICDNALTRAYSAGLTLVDHALMRDVLAELQVLDNGNTVPQSPPSLPQVDESPAPWKRTSSFLKRALRLPKSNNAPA